MIVSARNQFQGKVVSITEGSVNSLVAIEIAPDTVIQAVITKKAVEELGLAPGKEAYAIVKASEVIVGVDH
jgi:molybdopterin-binding protein